MQSSHCEAQDFTGILSNLDHNLLMHLALGYECRIYDFGSRGAMWERRGDETDEPGAAADALAPVALAPDAGAVDAGAEEGLTKLTKAPAAEMRYVPRAVWWGLEWARYALSTTWRLEARPPLLRGYNVQERFDGELRTLPKPLSKKLKYYRAYVNPEMAELRLRGYYAQTALDGNKDAYREFLHGHAARSGCDSRAPDPATFQTPLTAYDAEVARRVLG